MPFSNPIYTRKWTKMFAPVTSFITQIGKQLGLQTSFSQNSHDDVSIDMDVMSNGHVMKISDDDQSNPSSNSVSTFLSALISTIRPQARSKSSYGRRSYSKTSRYYQKQSNGTSNHGENNSIDHQSTIDMINDENNNTNNRNENDENSILIDLPLLSPSQSDEYLIPDSNEKYHFTTEHYIWIFLITILYFSWFIFIAGISIVHLVIYLLITLLYLLSDRTRRFALAILIYLSYLLLYDALHVVPNYTVSKVHIEDIYLLEKKLFGIVHDGQLITLNEYFKLHHKPFLDIFTGISYLNWIPIPLAYSLYLYRYKSKRDYMDFAFTFLLTNMLGFIIYYIVPAAPPWYIELYGFNMNMKTPGSPAGFENFDRLTGIKIFSSMYSKNANVFAALPSLHAAYPVLTILYGSLSKKLWLHIGFVFFTLSVWFSAIYSRHHYLLDVLAGGTCAVTAYILYRLLSRLGRINRLLVAYSKLI